MIKLYNYVLCRIHLSYGQDFTTNWRWDMMKKTWKDNLAARMKQQVKRHKRLKKPITIVMLLVTLFYNIGVYIEYNTKRFASVLVILIFFHRYNRWSPYASQRTICFEQ